MLYNFIKSIIPKKLKLLIKGIILLLINFNSIHYFFLAIINQTNVFLIKGGQIGHFPLNFFLCLQLYKKKAIFVTDPDFFVANEFLMKKLKEKYVFDNRYLNVTKIMKAINMISFGLFKFPEMPEQMHMTKKINFGKIIDPKFRVFNFTEQENQAGYDYLKKNNIDPKKFVCLLVRNSDYNLGIGKEKRETAQNLHRVVDPKIFIPSIDYLVQNNFTVIRMGKGFKDTFPFKSKQFIDYAISEDRNDFLDIWLSVNCSFYLNTSSGIATSIPTLFNRPRLDVCMFPIGRSQIWAPKVMYLYRMIKNKKNNQILNLKKQIELDLIWRINTAIYEALDVEVIENDPYDILEAVKQMINIYKKDDFLDHKNIEFWKKVKIEWDSQILKMKNNKKIFIVNIGVDKDSYTIGHTNFNFDYFNKIEGMKAIVADIFHEKYSKILFEEDSDI